VKTSVKSSPIGSLKTSVKSSKRAETSVKTSVKILEVILDDKLITIPALSALIGVTERSIERNIRRLQAQGRLRRIGPDKGGHWEVIDKTKG